jgi:hypothetical protein
MLRVLPRGARAARGPFVRAAATRGAATAAPPPPLAASPPPTLPPPPARDATAAHVDLSGAPGVTLDALGLRIFPDFVSEAEEALLLRAADALLRRKPWEASHFDGVAEG